MANDDTPHAMVDAAGRICKFQFTMIHEIHKQIKLDSFQNSKHKLRQKSALHANNCCCEPGSKERKTKVMLLEKRQFDELLEETLILTPCVIQHSTIS